MTASCRPMAALSGSGLGRGGGGGFFGDNAFSKTMGDIAGEIWKSEGYVQVKGRRGVSRASWDDKLV